MRNFFFGVLLFIVSFFHLIPIWAQILNRDWVSYYSGQLTSVSDILYEPVCDCIYIAGYTADDTGIATAGAHKEIFTYSSVPLFTPDINFWKTDAFLAKFDLEGNRIWGTYIGGQEEEKLVRIAADKWGNVFVTGTTKSEEGIATPGAFIETKSNLGTLSSYLMKFDADGALQWSTYYDVFSADSNQYASAICTDVEGNVYIGGRTLSSGVGLATSGAHQSLYGGGAKDGYIAKFSPDGDRIWATYYGGEGEDEINGLACTKDGYLYSVGMTTSSSGIATSGVFQSSRLNDSFDVSFLVKWNALDGNRMWGTYISTTHDATIGGSAVGVDSFGNVYVFAEAFYFSLPLSTEDLSTVGTHQETPSGGTDVVVMKFNSSGSRVWGTYFGGSNDESLSVNLAWGSPTFFIKNPRISSDGTKLYINGYTTSNSGIATDCGYLTSSGHKRGFITEFNTANGKRNWGSYYDAEINNIAIRDGQTKDFNLFFASRTQIDSLATPGSHRPSKSGLNVSGLLGKMTIACPDETVSLTQTEDELQASEGFEQYTWYRNGVVIASGTDNSIVLSDTGNYHVVANLCGCVYTSNTVHVSSLAIEDVLHAKNLLQFYPNPASEELWIQLPIASNQSAEVVLIDLLGRSQKVPGTVSAHNGKIRLSTDGLGSGSYFVRVAMSGKVYYGKLVIVK